MSEDKLQRFKEILDSFDNAMLVSHSPDGSLRARPMAIAGVGNDGELWFITSIESPKVEELEREPSVAIVAQSGTKFLSISGLAEVRRDRDVIEEHWLPEFNLWFEEGQQDPTATAIRLVPTRAEYWDRSGLKPWRHAFDIVMAMFPGQTLDEHELEDHAKLDL
jgi:general stress protein 26